MKTHRLRVLAALFVFASIIASGTSATPTGKSTPTDVALRDGRVLVGQAVDPRGVALVRAPVSIKQAGQEIIRVVTNVQGEFTVAGLKGGVYQVAISGCECEYRMWEPQTAPNTASKSLVVVSSGRKASPDKNRRSSFVEVTSWVTQNPLMPAGGIATVIAIPYASIKSKTQR